MLRELSLILWKNLLIRKRHWLLTLTEVLIPVILFTLIAYGRSKISGLNKVQVNSATYHETKDLYEIYSYLPVEELNLWYSPYNDFTESIMRSVQLQIQIKADAVKKFDSKIALLNHFQKNSSSSIFAVNFVGDSRTQLSYEIGIFDKYLVWDTDKLFMPIMVDDEDTSLSKYLNKGFTALQLAVDMAFLQMHNPQKNIRFSIQEFPFPPHVADSAINDLFICYIPLITIFSFIFLCPAVLQRVGEEKQSGTKEFMKMVGMKSWMIWLGWFIHALITNLLSIIIVVVLMKVPFWGVPYPPIEFTDGVVLFVFLFLYCMAAVTFCFLIGTIFSTPTVATVVGILIWMLSYFIPENAISCNDNLNWGYKMLLAIFPNMALYYGYSAISLYEIREVGVHWYNIMQPGSGGRNDVTMGNVFFMFIFDMIFFMTLTLYIENIKPGKYGIPKSYAYPIVHLKNWIKELRRKNYSLEDERMMHLIDRGADRKKIEIRGLGKRFSSKVAVKDLNMRIAENEITVLLGHNGAGKTTAMAIITGMISPTSGYVLINGKDIKEDTDAARKVMGLCPHHNLLFPDLTVIEQLMFFAKLKGSSDPRQEAKDILKKFDIDCKENELVSTLSGGTKRKLCLGMAIIGNSNILILGEPTSGMDPESRRKVWDLLLEYRKTKTILITTHFMEEADVLGDRIAIMDHGQLLCYDTPIGLKTKYKTGYHLSLRFNLDSLISKESAESTQDIQKIKEEPLSSKKTVDKVTQEIKKSIPNAKLIRETHDTVVYLLPLDQKAKYREVFDLLESKKDAYDIINIGLDITTLEDVFLKARIHEDETDGKSNIPEIPEYNPPSSYLRFFRQILALISKRGYIYRRKFYWYIPASLVSSVIFLLAMLSAMSAMENLNDGGPELNLSLKAYCRTEVLYSGQNSTDPTVANLASIYNELALLDYGDPIFQEHVSDGIIQKGIENIAFYKRHMIVAAEFNATENENEIAVNALYSPRSYHGLPISINLAMNSVVKALINESFSISVKNSPLKQANANYAPSELSAINVACLWLILISISMTFFISNYIIFPNLEVTTHFLRLQTIAGVSPFLYWTTNCVVDLLWSSFKFIDLFILFGLTNWIFFDSLIFQEREYLAIAAIFAVFIFSSLPFTYLFSYRKTVAGGFSLLIMGCIFLGIIPALIVIALEFSNDQLFTQISKVLKHVMLMCSPQFGLSYVYVKFSRKFVDNFNWRYMHPIQRQYICVHDPNPCCYGEASEQCSVYESYFHNDKFGIQYDILEMFVSFVIYFFILTYVINADWIKEIFIKLEYLVYSLKLPQKKKPGEVEPTDEKIKEGSLLIVKNLVKFFRAKPIVDNLKFSVMKQKCFGLLGVNGAGKSTTFHVLTKSIICNEGDIRIKKFPISHDGYKNKISYCPQEDSLNLFLTAAQLLYTLALMNGYSCTEATNVTSSLLKTFELDKYADQPCYEYSGGNKRKLNTSIAFLGNRRVIMLDEPTSGVDPVSRRKFWKVLSYLKKVKKSSYILCSHSMDECENLCDDIAIMKDGQFKKQGSLLALKDESEVGFKIMVKLKNDCTTENVDSLKKALTSRLNGKLQSEHGGSVEYAVTENKRLSQLFGELEDLKDKNSVIDDYVISQPSLEDVFLKVAQEEGKENNKSKDRGKSENLKKKNSSLNEVTV